MGRVVLDTIGSSRVKGKEHILEKEQFQHSVSHVVGSPQVGNMKFCSYAKDQCTLEQINAEQ